jgi:glutamate synthase domain-containing protein 2/formate hydrogenlyase subunit 6/NADH:ubiquinone oxidoreductase subunit I
MNYIPREFREYKHNPKPDVTREGKHTPSRFRNAIGKFRVVRSDKCIACGLCAELCPWGVHVKYKGYKRMARPKDYLCRGYHCMQDCKEKYCIDKCPVNALSLRINPVYETIGDARWPADMILSTWDQAENGTITNDTLEANLGESNGGFDKLRLKFPARIKKKLKPSDIDTSIILNRRNDGRDECRIDVPWYGGGMSFGSVSTATMVSKAAACEIWNTFSCSGEGGYPPHLMPYDNNMITQVATGLFGVREDSIQRVRIIEFKYAQGAKPGLGGHLLGDKNTPAVAKMREAVPGMSLFSPFPFHSVYSIEDHKKHIDWIMAMNPNALVSAKVSTPTDVDMVAVGSYYAGAHISHIDGSYGGTGAAPDIAKKNIAMPVEYAIPKVHGFLTAEGIRDKITLIASGGLRCAHDIIKAICLGADGVVIGTSELVAMECIRCGNCESGRGCARGIASTDPELSLLYDEHWGTARLVNMYKSWREQIVDILIKFGLRSIRDLVGRTDLLSHIDYED